MTAADATEAEIAELRREIEAVLEPPAGKLVSAYFEPNGPFAGSTFDTIGENERDEIGMDDLLAVSFLDVAVKPRAARAILLENRSELTELLAPIPTDVDLWDATDEHLDTAGLLWDRLNTPTYPQVGEVIAGKLLARKRPRLIPVVDRWTVIALPTADGRVWRTLRQALTDETLRTRIEDLRTARCAAATSTLRLLDAAVWMRYSESDNARHVRVQEGLAVGPR